LVEAPIACGDVVSIDSTDARMVRGFVDLVSYPESEALKFSRTIALIRERTLHFQGQPVALVLAETLASAQSAARAVQVETLSRPAITALDQAVEHAYTPQLAGRIPAMSRRGDIIEALGGASLAIRNRYETAVNNHHPLEPHAVVCWWEGEKAVVHTNTQAVFAARALLAHAFQTPPENIRVLSRFLGGGFGCKGQLWWPWMILAMLGAKRTGRPVRLELTRAQLFNLAGRRHATVQDLALGFNAAGKLTAIDHDVLGQTSTHGEYTDPTANVSRWLYACPNVTTRHRLVRTNEPQPIPMRAPGVAPGLFALESAMDEAADRLGIDPVELRVRNFAGHDQDADRPWTSNSLLACYRIGAERFGWAQRPARGTMSDGKWRLGWGMASSCYGAHSQSAKARVKLEPDAQLLVQCGTQDMGSGTYTVLAQVAADILGLSASDVRVELGDTDLPEGPISAGSWVTASIVPALNQAASAVRARLADLATGDAASLLAGHRIDDLDFKDGRIVSRGGNVSERLADLLKRHSPAGLEAEGAWAPPAAPARSGMAYGAVFVEIAVDPDLGETRVRRVYAAFAAGRIVNALLAKSQYVGGLIGGIGQALHERTVTERTSGHILGANFADYRIPVHADMPEFDVTAVEEEDPYLPGGVKGVGMLGSAGVQAAIANAVFHAVGRRVRHLPIRIEDLLAER
jgi:xanthine dehydrogenase YagR molybdenum-binding subunit